MYLAFMIILILFYAVIQNTQVHGTTRPVEIETKAGQLFEPFRPRLSGRNSVKSTTHKSLYE